MTGNYDELRQPTVIAEGFDYVLFTNDMPEQRIGIWQVRNIPYINRNNTRVARWVKTHPHVLLCEYDVSLWHDANVQVDKPEYFHQIKELISSKVLIASMDHIHRHCIYKEAFEIIYLNLDKMKKVLQEIAHIKHNGYPINNGLIETNCILRFHKDHKVIQFCENWWTMIDRYSSRDQLSFNYVAWKCDMDIMLILPQGSSTRNHPYIHCNMHQRRSTIDDIIWYGSIKDKFATHAQKYYIQFTSSKKYSIAEYYSYAMMYIIRKYYSLVEKKYKIATRIKKALSHYSPEQDYYL